MSDKEILELLRESFVSEDAPPLSAEEAEILLSAPLPTKSSPSTLKKMRKRSVVKILARLHQEPVRSVRRGVRFGLWLSQARESARLTRVDVASAMGKEPSFIEKVEEEEILPWKITPSVMANIVILFRVHLDAVTQLLSSSFEAKREAEEYQRQLKAFLQNPSAPYSDMRAALIDPTERRRPVSTEQKSSKVHELDEEIIRFLDKLRKILELRQAIDLL